MTVALVAHASVVNGTSASVDTTGATLIVLGAVWYNNGTDGVTVSDNQGNSYTALTNYDGNGCDAKLYYCASPTVGSGHSFTISGSDNIGTLYAAAFSGTASASPLDTASGAGTSSSVSSFQPGSITPGGNNELVVTVNAQAGSSPTINDGYTITDSKNLVASTNFGGGLAYLVQSTAAATNPSWSWTTASAAAAAIAAFKAASGGGGGVVPPVGTFPLIGLATAFRWIAHRREKLAALRRKGAWE